jgi:hypothetical protein
LKDSIRCLGVCSGKGYSVLGYKGGNFLSLASKMFIESLTKDVCYAGEVDTSNWGCWRTAECELAVAWRGDTNATSR